MKKLLLIFVMFVALVSSSKNVYCQYKEPQPFIVSIVPDSLFMLYDYSQVKFFIVTIGSKIMGDPTEGAVTDLNKQIVDFCKKQKFDGFILSQIVFTKPFDEGKLIAYGTLIRKKVKTKK